MLCRAVIAAFLCVVLAAALFAWRLARGPLSLDFLIPHFTDALRDPAGEWRTEIRRIVLTHDFRVHAHDVAILDARDNTVLKIPDVILRPSLAALLGGRLLLRAIELRGAEASLVRRPDGSVGISAASAGAPGGVAVDRGDESDVLSELVNPGEGSPIRFLRSVRLTEGRVRVYDARSSVTVRMESANMVFSRLDGALALTLDARVFPGEGAQPTPITAALEMRPDADGIAIGGQLRAGKTDVSRLGLYWPEHLAARARRWVTDSIRDGRVDEIVLEISLSSMPGGRLELGRIDGSFRYSGLTLRWSELAPEVSEIAGRATFDRSGLRFDVSSARSGAMRIDAARVSVVGLGGEGRVVGEVVGEAAVVDVLALVSAVATDIPPLDAEGNGTLEVGVSFPLRSGLSFADVDLEVDFKPRAVRLRRSHLDALVSGELRYRKPAGGHGAVDAKVTLQQARFQAGPFRWVQPSQRSGTVGLRLSFEDTAWRVDPIQVDCPGLQATGTVVRSAADGTISLHLRDVVYGDTTLAALTATWNQRALTAHLSRGTVDLAPWLERQKGSDPVGMSAQNGGDLDLDLVASQLERVSFGAGGWLEKVEASLVRGDGEWRKLVVDGELPRALWSSTSSGQMRKELSVRLEPSAAGRRLEVTTDDLGALLRAIHVTDGIRGGTLVVSGRNDVSGRDAGWRAQVHAANFTFVEAPWLLRVLAVASLDRIVGILRSGGLTFDALKGVVVARGGRYELQEFRARGSSLGLTAAGWVDTDVDRLSIEGTLIPADAASQVLRNIPLLGNLLTGSDGGGLVAIGYKVRGSLFNPKVSANALTALTPGMLREIWELPRKE